MLRMLLITIIIIIIIILASPYSHTQTHERNGTHATKSARSSSSFPTIKRSGTMKLLINELINYGSLTIVFYRAAKNVTFARQIKAPPASAITQVRLTFTYFHEDAA